MYGISLRVHQLQYVRLIPKAHRRRFDAHYTFSKDKKDAYVATVRQRLTAEGWYGWMAEVEGRTVGFVLAKRENEHLVLKQRLFVDPKFQGRGVGGALLNAPASIVKSGDVVRLKVIGSNERARRLYAAHGFSVKGNAKETFYGAKLVVMERRVD